MRLNLTRLRALPRRSPRRTAAVVAAALLAVTAVAAAAPTASAAPTPPTPFPAGDAFYTPPSPLPAGAPGDVIRWRKTTIGALYGFIAPAKADAYQMMYLSRDGGDRPIAVTGTVFVPQGRSPANMPIVGYAASTHGIGDTCAPSRELVKGNDTDLININDAITRGWAVAEGDYEGLGTPGDHTYMVGRSQAHSVLDAVRAAQRLTVAGLPRSGPVGLWGYSQGGGAVSWAAQLASSYAPELKLAGSAAGGTPADLQVVADNLNNGFNPGFAFLMMAAGGLNAAYPELDLPRYLNDAGRAAFEDLRGSTCANQALVKYAFGTAAKYTTTNPLTRPDWRARVQQQKLGLIKPSRPVFLYHGMQDEFIPYGQAVQLKKDWCALGQRIQFGTFIGEHITTFLTGQVDAQNFLADRFAGKPAPSSC